MSTVEDKAQIMALRLAMELAWTAILQGSSDPLRDAAALKRKSNDVLWEVARDNPEAAGFCAVTVKHSESLWESIETRLRARTE